MLKDEGTETQIQPARVSSLSSFSEKQRAQGKAGTGSNQPALSWKMFWVIFFFYLVLGFKNIIWQYFFPSKKTGK